ncbi:hypothetical protein EX30DRAFT_349724 [Ascodesmis nigricans]|uniref:Uncharacterized protein n=1 Tax=Ascodesmis nigricans TaxID=341454 RepID=A0A4S2MTW4_9PEZI|nr:hypothetical protein EX30DRAFT_349724 [Ascodesmis nigricans]
MRFSLLLGIALAVSLSYTVSGAPLPSGQPPGKSGPDSLDAIFAAESTANPTTTTASRGSKTHSTILKNSGINPADAQGGIIESKTFDRSSMRIDPGTTAATTDSRGRDQQSTSGAGQPKPRSRSRARQTLDAAGATARATALKTKKSFENFAGRFREPNVEFDMLTPPQAGQSGGSSDIPPVPTAQNKKKNRGAAVVGDPNTLYYPPSDRDSTGSK